jgi:ribosomal protein L24
VEARDRRHVEAAFTQGRKITLIPPEEHAALVAWFDQDSRRLLPEGTWVRFRRGDLKGDVGIVVRSSQADDFVTVAAIPRMPLPPTSAMQLPTQKRRKTAATSRTLFDPDSIEAAFGKGSVNKLNDQCTFQKRTYVSGLRLQRLQAAHHLVEEPYPALDDALLFRESGWKEIMQSVGDALRRGSIASTWQAGDKVDIMHGELAGLSGELKSLNLELWSAEIEAFANIAGTIQVSLEFLARHVSVGKSVVVIAGKNRGRQGVVVSSDGEYVTFVEDKSRDEVCLLGPLAALD